MALKVIERDFTEEEMATISLLAQVVKDLPEMQEAQVTAQGREDPLEEGMATHSSMLAWRIPWTEELGGLQSIGSQSQTRLK